MKNSLILLGALVITTAGGYWAMKSLMPGANDEKLVTLDVVSRKPNVGKAEKDWLGPLLATLSRQVAPERDFEPTPTTYPSEGGSRFHEGSQEEACVYNLKNPAEREQLAASLKQGDISEEEISATSGDLLEHKVSLEKEQSSEEAVTYNLNDPSEKERLTNSLRQGDISEEEISATSGDLSEHKVSLEKEQSSEEAVTYNLNDPSEKERLTNSLRQGDISEEEISATSGDLSEHKVSH